MERDLGVLDFRFWGLDFGFWGGRGKVGMWHVA